MVRASICAGIIATAVFSAVAEDVVEIKAAQHPDGRGGLMLKIRTNGGDWRDAAKPERGEARIDPNFERELPPYSVTVLAF